MEGRSKGTAFTLAPVEGKKDGVGIGVFGFLSYLTAAISTKLPAVMDWKEATVLFLRKAVAFNNKSATTIMDKLSDDCEFEKDVEARRIWPMPKEAIPDTREEVPRTGGRLFVLIAGQNKNCFITR